MQIFRQSPNARDEAGAAVTAETSAGGGYPPELAVLDAVRPLECLLTAKDYSLIEHHMLTEVERQGELSLLVKLMRAKLTDAQIVMADDLPPDIAPGNSRVEFSIDNGADDQRVLCFWDHDALAHLGLPRDDHSGRDLVRAPGRAEGAVDRTGRDDPRDRTQDGYFSAGAARQSMRRHFREGGDGS